MARFQLREGGELPGFNVVDFLGCRFFPGWGRAFELVEINLNIPPYAGGEAGKSLLDFDYAHWPKRGDGFWPVKRWGLLWLS